jgi:small subunit ribosomal protein S15
MNQEQVQLDAEKVKEIILDLWKKGHSKSDIGRILKEQYNIYDVRNIFGKRLTKVLEDLGVKEDIPEDLRFLFRKAFRVMKHLEQHKHDTHSKKALEHIEARIKVLIRYYIRKKKLPPNFRYSKELVKIYGST